MTPAVKNLKKADTPYQLHAYDPDPNSKSYGRQAAEKLDISFDQLFKTLIIADEKKNMFTALVPVSRQLNLRALVKIIGSKKIKMADKKDAERSTGYISGGISPIGQKKRLRTFIDKSALEFKTVFVSAGRRGLQIELSPKDLASLTGADFYTLGK